MIPMSHTVLALAFALSCHCGTAAPPAAQRHDLKARASGIDPAAREHPEIRFTFGTADKPLDLQHACVDTRVPPRGKLVIWLMGHNQELFERLSGHGFHAIQVHYANGWFSKLYPDPPPEDDLFLSKVRLEAAMATEGCTAFTRSAAAGSRSYAVTG